MSVLLPTRSVAKPWGKDLLPAPFVAPPGERIGEVWFEPPPELPQLLVKYIFTSEALSVQVHPSDAQLPGHGKEECWLVIDVEPGAKLGIGFIRALGTEEMRNAALDGSIELLLDWHRVSAGDFFYIPAGTVHAIGAGVSLIEVQQNSDVTYRIYDYGRPRDLHLEESLAVAKAGPYGRESYAHLAENGEVTLVDGPLFRLDRLDGPASAAVAGRYGAAPLLVIPRSAGVSVSGEQIAPGECALAASLGEVALAAFAQTLIAQPQ
ncbi:MAG: class I mannose-6-phosphate isomerase [Novosphingobium sp.]